MKPLSENQTEFAPSREFQPSRKPFSVSGVLITLLLIPLTNLFPLHGPETRTWISSLPDWLRPLFLFPSDHLISDPVIRMTATVGVGLVILYLLMDFTRHERFLKREVVWREVVIWLLIGVFVIMPLCMTMMKRFDDERSVYSHDGGIYQTTEAIEMLLAGQNPYSCDYQGIYMTMYARQSGIEEPLFHNPYLPGSFLLPVPVYFLSQAIFGMHFQRLFYLICFLLMLLIVRAMSTGENRLAMLVAVGLNPAVAYFLHQGRNDIGLAVLILATIWFVDRRWFIFAGILLGCACSYKQLAWFTVPFFWIYLGGTHRNETTSRLKMGIALSIVMIILIGPFIIWDAPALYDDTFAFNAGSSEHPYKLGGTPGFGASNLLLYWNLVESRASYFPFTIPMLLVGIPLFFILGKQMMKHNTRTNLFASMALISFVIPYFSRFFHDNYFAFISICVAVSYFSEEIPNETD